MNLSRPSGGGGSPVPPKGYRGCFASVAALALPTNGFAVGAAARCVLAPLDPALASRTRGVLG